jgi:aspartyl-tRNA(Asn)/glutamyl-tRNA(Gln) amidotransferase subunit C
MSVTEQDVQRVAELANLELDSAEQTAMVRDLNSLLNYFGQLNELDTTAVSPMTQVAETEDLSVQLRPDELAPSLEREQVLSSAPDTDHVFFRVPKVIER